MKEISESDNRLRYLQIIAITEDCTNKTIVQFTKQVSLVIEHIQKEKEVHCLDFVSLGIEQFYGSLFHMDTNNWFRRIEGKGIQLIPINKKPIFIPGIAIDNFGNIPANLDMYLKHNQDVIKHFDIHECQEWVQL